MEAMKRAGGLGLVAAVAIAVTFPALAKDYLLTGVKPDKLVLIDAAARKVEKTLTIPDAAPGPATITPSPDGKIAYVLVNRWESVSGIDLDSGKQVFRANFSGGGRRIKGCLLYTSPSPRDS